MFPFRSFIILALTKFWVYEVSTEVHFSVYKYPIVLVPFVEKSGVNFVPQCDFTDLT